MDGPWIWIRVRIATLRMAIEALKDLAVQGHWRKQRAAADQIDEAAEELRKAMIEGMKEDKHP